MVTTEQAPHTEPKQQERATSREKLAQEKLRREFAAIALLAILIATYQNRESDHLFAEPEQPKQKDEPETHTKHTNNRAEIFSLINHAFTDRTTRRIRSNAQSKGANLGGYASYEPSGVYMSDIADYRQSIFKPAPEFTPAPSMSDTELGPQLPNLAFNDRIRPENTGTRSASDADFAAADRANEMYQRALFDTGWRGGEATPEQQKAGARAMIREYHPDLPATSAADAEAVKMFNANHAKPVSKGEGSQGEA